MMIKMMTKRPKNDFKIESTSSRSRFKNQEKFDFKIQEKMNSRFKRRSQEDFTREVLKSFFKKQT